MKTWTFAAFLTGILLVPFIVRRRNNSGSIEKLSTDQRYTIDDLIADQGSLS